MHCSWLLRAKRAALVVLLAGAGAAAIPAAQAYAATGYYVNCSASSNGSGSASSPWNTLSSVNSHTFGAGDTINFVTGTTCVGQLTPKGSGSSSSPITMTSSGTGAMPVINGNGATGPVIHLVNQQYWTFSNLALTNSASSAAYRSGILADNSSGGTLHGIHVSGMYIHNISGWAGGWYATNAAVGIQTFHTSPESTWDDIDISDNVIDSVNRIGVAVTDDTDGQGTGQTTNVHITGNTITNSGGDDILVVHGSGAVIDHNVTAFGGSKSHAGCPPSGQYCNGASASIWIAGSNDSTIEYNEAYCELNSSDGMGFDVDWGNHNALVQYNYSHQNGGGFLLVMPPDSSFTSEPWAVQGSYGVVVRDNISDNDGVTTGCPNPAGHDVNQGIITFGGQIPNVSGEPIPTFYNNSFYLPSTQSTPVIYSRAGSSPHGSYVFENNIVENHGSGGYITTTGSTFSHNDFYGNHPSTEPADPGGITSNPTFQNPGNTSSTSAFRGAAAYVLKSGSPAIHAGTVISSNGGLDFFGNTVSSSSAPNIGADNGGGTGSTNLVSNAGFESGALSPWALSGSGSSVVTGNAHSGTYALQTGDANSGADVTISGLSSNTAYVLTAYEKVATPGEQISLGVKSFGGTETFAKVGTTGYTLATVTFKTGSSNTSANIYCYKNTGVGHGYCDDVALTKG